MIFVDDRTGMASGALFKHWWSALWWSITGSQRAAHSARFQSFSDWTKADLWLGP